MHFYHGNFLGEKKDQRLFYFLIDKKFKEFRDKEMQLGLKGEEIKDIEENSMYKPKASITIDKAKKTFNFLVEWDDQGNGYGRAIYENYMHILDLLGIVNSDEYTLMVANQSNHAFLKNMQTEKMVKKTDSNPDKENALKILSEFANYPDSVRLKDVNVIVEYAIKSGISTEQIADAINTNGFNIRYDTYNGNPHLKKKDMQKFQSFNISGLKLTCMHNHFINKKSFGFLQLITNPDTEDATLEFKKIFEMVKTEHEEMKKKGEYIPPNLEEYGELEHIILDWEYSGLLFKHVSPEIRDIIKKQAIQSFENFDLDHNDRYSYHPFGDNNSVKTFEVLMDADMMDKDTYILLYQKALNRNYNLNEFDNRNI